MDTLGPWAEPSSIRDDAYRTLAGIEPGALGEPAQVIAGRPLQRSHSMIFIPLKDMQEVQFLKDNDSLVAKRARTAANPALHRPGVPGVLDAVLLRLSSTPRFDR